MSLLIRVLVMLGFTTRKIPVLLAGSNHIYTCMSGNPARFPSPPVSMPAFLALVQGVSTAQEPMATRAKGAKANRTTKVVPLVAALTQLVAYVQGLCDGSIDEATSIIEAAGMAVRPGPSHHKPALTLATVLPSGTLKAVANATLLASSSKKNRQFNWRISTDGEKTWTTLPSTPSARTTIGNLTPLTTVAVQVSVTLTDQPMGAWSQAVTILVL